MKVCKRVLSLVTMIAVAASVTIGATIAPYTDAEEAANTFSVGIGAVKVAEPEWEKLTDEDKILYPGKELLKDPIVKNTGNVALYVFVQVRIPAATVRTVGEDNVTVSDAEYQPLFSFELEEGFTKLAESGEYTVYGYTRGALEPGEETTPLFKSIRFINVLEGDIPEGTELEVVVSAVGIQKSFLDITQSDDAASTLQEVFDTYSGELLAALSES